MNKAIGKDNLIMLYLIYKIKRGDKYENIKINRPRARNVNIDIK